MKKYLFASFICLLAVCSWAKEKDEKKVIRAFAEQNIIWHGQSAIEIHDKLIIFADPYKLKSPAKADLILITHPHQDHLSPEDLKKIQTPDTVIVAPDDPECRKKLSGEVMFVKPGESVAVKGVSIYAVPAYNVGVRFFHKKSDNWVGYIITVDKIRIYIPGDTDRIPEMKQFKADIAFMPVGGMFTMGPEEAADAVLDINPAIVIPVHFGMIPGSGGNGEKFKKILDNKLAVLIKIEK